MHVSMERNDDVLTVTVDGRLDGANVAAFEEDLRTAIDEKDRAVLIDCEKLKYINSAGLRIVLLTAKALVNQNAKFALCSMSDPVRSVFQISGFDKIVAIHASRDGALAFFTET